MKKILPILLALAVSAAAVSATLSPVQLLNPAGSTSGQAILSTGASTAPSWATPSSANVNFQQAGTGVVTRTTQDKLRDTVSIQDFSGCDITGSADSTACVQAAANSLLGGGRVKITGKLLVSNNLTVPVGVTLEGDCVMPGTIGNNSSTPYGTLTCGVLMVSPTATISMLSGSGLKSLLVYRSGMTFPAANSSAFAGTAITANGDDVSVDSVMVMGFNKGFYSYNWQRTRIEYFYGDNINGIEVGSSYDIAYISHSHMWPFATIASGGSYTNHIRSGKAYYLHDTADWAKITDCFSWGYFRGYVITNANSATLLGVGADNVFDGTPLHTGAIGIVIDGTSQDTRIIGAQTAAQQTAGIYVDTVAGAVTTIIGHNAWGGSTHGEWVNSGDVITSGGVMRGVSNGITETNAASRVTATGMRFQQIAGNPINPSNASSLIFLSDNDYGDYTGTVASASFTAQSVASADPLALPNSGKVFNVTGTTNFGTLNGGFAGRTVTLIFSGNLSVFNGPSMGLKNGANFTASAGSSLTLTHNGTKWTETGRSETTANPASVTTLAASGQITSTVATGAAPFVVSSTTPVVNLSIGGNAATASAAPWGGITSTPTTLTGYGITATSAQLAATITDETGTGSAVFATSPVLSGTPAIAAATGTSLFLTGSGAAQTDLTVTNTAANGAGIKLVGNGGTTPGKTIRASGGNLQVVNDAYSAVIASLTDTGNLTAVGGLDGTAIGANTASTGKFTTVNVTSNAGSAGAIAAADTTSNGVNVKLTGNGATAPTKHIRVIDGNLQVVNNAYSAVLMSLSDAGGLSSLSSLAVNGSASSTTQTHSQQEIDTSYTYNQPTTGQTVTLASGTQTAIIDPAGTLDALTVTLPACTSGYNGSLARFSSSQIVTTLTVNATSGTVVGGPASLAVGSGNGYICRGANTTWYRLH